MQTASSTSFIMLEPISMKHALDARSNPWLDTEYINDVCC